MTNAPAATDVLNREFLTMRTRLLDLAAAMDRVGRASGQASQDPRLEKIHRGLRVLLDGTHDRAEQIQMVFSLPYEENWRKE